MFTDYHVHTEFSDDSAYPMEQVVKDAIAMQMDEICFTDHMDYGVKRDWDCGQLIDCPGKELPPNVNCPLYAATIKELKHKYGMQIQIKLGMEFGMQMHTIPQYEALFQKYPFDFIILSVHEIENQPFWSQDFQKGKSQKEYNERYYEEMLKLVKAYKNYSVLGHVDLITRYDQNGIYPFEKIKPVVSEILKIVIADGKGIELNTSYHRYGLKDTTPSVDILKLYRRLGGTIITIGSDSHRPEQLGAYFEDAKRLLKDLGFTQLCVYDKMRPVFVPL